jgi:hypothetical protein
MLKRNLIRKFSLLIALFLTVNATSVCAQSSGSGQQPANKQVLVDAEFLKEVEIKLAEREKFKSQSEAKDEVIAGKDAQIAALRGLLQVEKLISTDWKESALARKDALKTDDKLILQYDKRVAELQAERDSARRNGRLYAVGGVIVGVLAGVFAAKN